MFPTSEDRELEVTYLSILKGKWKYRGEGNANLVISLPENRVILRLHKTRRDSPALGNLEFEEMNRVCREALFCRKVMVPLLGKAYIQPPSVGRVPDKEIQQLDHILLPQRPKFRHHKGVTFGYVNIYPDYALLPERLTQHAPSLLHNHLEPTFCVEIKPKQGWIPYNQFQHPKCTFCLNQYLKLSNGAISRISQYCPLDLFSGDEKRMNKAIKSLLKTPQNNLKIFKDGFLVYSEECNQELSHILRQWLEPSSSPLPVTHEESLRLIDRFSILVRHALTSDLLQKDSHLLYNKLICYPRHNSEVKGSLPESLEPCDLSSKPLPSNCILNRILGIQMLQQSDTENIHRILWQNGECGDYDYVSKLWDPETNQLHLDPVQRYLLATTAKDCSILIAFQRLRNENSVEPQHIAVEPSSGLKFVFNIGVSDLDPKPLSCVEKHLKRDADILFACRNLLQN